MSEPHVCKHCPECGAEYRPEVIHCVDCRGVELVPGEAPASGPLGSFPPASELELVRVAPMAWIQTLSRELQEDGVAHRVQTASAEDAPAEQRADVFGAVQLFGLYVREADLAGAREIDATIAATLLPEEAPPLEEGDEDTCPACGTALAPDVLECPDCGLGFG